jgi:hypothetical protein
METYNVLISSKNKISGNNNNAYFNVPWDTILDDHYRMYLVSTTFTSRSGLFVDGTYSSVDKWFGSAKLSIDLQCSSQVYDTQRQGASNLFGCISRLHDTSVGSSIMKASLLDIPPRTISMPSSGFVNVAITDMDDVPFVDTTSSNTLDTDMPDWVLQLSFVPIESSYVDKR